MRVEVTAKLHDLASQLDRNGLVCVKDGGFVELSGPPVPPSTLGQDKNYVSRKAKLAFGSWQGTRGEPWKAARPRSPSSATPVFGTGLREQYEAELDEVFQAYPGSSVWFHKGGMWILVESAVVAGLDKKATFLLAIPFSGGLPAKAWAFWTTSISWEWIGPRHSNFPDGSVCAFDHRDQTWTVGESLIKLLDLYSVWACRHLCLKVFGSWPGFQSVFHPLERLLELNDNEFCGCDESAGSYAQCCKRRDLAENRAEMFADFLSKFSCFGVRKPPTAILQFMSNRSDPPSFNAAFPAPFKTRTLLRTNIQRCLRT
jgi:hypothetical protein